MKTNYIFVLYLIFFSGCQTTQNVGIMPRIKIESKFAFGKEAIDHLVTHCTVYKIKSVHDPLLKGKLCAFSEYDLFTYQKNLLSAQEKNGRVLWSARPLNLNHPLQIAPGGREVLAIGKQFWRGKEGDCNVADSLLIFNNGGKVVNSFDFGTFILSRSLGTDAQQKLVDPGNICAKGKLPVKLASDVLSFQKFYSRGNRENPGYLSLEASIRKLILFDNSLNVVKIHTLYNHYLQSPVQTGDDRLLFYELVPNEGAFSPQLTEYNLEDRSFQVVYKSPLVVKSPYDCGSIAVVSPDQLYIAHSACTSKDPADYFQIELVDLKTHSSKISKVKQ